MIVLYSLWSSNLLKPVWILFFFWDFGLSLPPPDVIALPAVYMRHHSSDFHRHKQTRHLVVFDNPRSNLPFT